MNNILQIVPSLDSGGVERGTIEIANALEKSDFNSFICSSGGKLVKELKCTKHITLPVNTKNPITAIVNVFKIIKIIKQYNINLLHVRSRAPAWSTYFASKFTSVPMLASFHGTYSLGNKVKEFYNSIMLMGNHIIAVSEFIKRHILQNYSNGKQDKITVINRGVDIEYFSPTNITKASITKLYKSFNIPKNAFVILMPDRFTDWKGHLYLLDIFEQIKDINFYCIMIGKTEHKKQSYYNRVLQKIVDKGLQNKVVCKEPAIDIRPYYSLADLVVSPTTRAEAFGRTIIEAQAMKTLIAGTDIGGVSDTIKHGKTGFHFALNDAKKAAIMLKKIISLTKEKKETILSNAYKKAHEEFTTQIMCQKELALYKSLINQV